MLRKLVPRTSHMQLGVIMVAALGFAIRVPSVFAEQSLEFDDGVYLSSIRAMRLGFDPFKEIFSSQGPLFLPLLRLFDIVGAERYWAPRLAMAGAGAALGGMAAATIARWKGLPAVWGAGLAVAFSGSALVASSGLEAEGVAVAFALGAFYLVSSIKLTKHHMLAAGLLLGIAVSIKSLFVVPAALAVAWVIWRRSGLRDLGLAGAAGLLVTLAAFVWWGAPEVWNQYVAFHLDAASERNPLRNVLELGGRALIYERPAILLGLPAAVMLAARMTGRSSYRREDAANDDAVPRVVVQGLSIWTASTMLLLILHSPLFPRHSVFLLVPAVLLVAMITTTAKWVLSAVVVGVGVQLLTLNWIPSPDPVQEDAIEALRLLPGDTDIVTDEPGLAYFAGLAIPPNLVDPSFVRIAAGHLTQSEVESGLYAPNTCAALFWSGRFDELGLDAEALDQYQVVDRFGPNRLLAVRTDCR